MRSHVRQADRRAASEVLSLWEILPIISMMRGDERILRFISVLGACVIRDHTSYPSPEHQHINQPISILLMRGWEGSAMWPLIVTLGFRMDRGGGAGTDTGCSWIMDDVSRASTLAVQSISQQRISLINDHQGERRRLLLVTYSEELMVKFCDHEAMSFVTC